MTMSPASSRSPSCVDRLLGDVAGRQHHPDGARPVGERLDQFGDRTGVRGAVLGQGFARLAAGVVDHAVDGHPHQPAGDIAAHAAQADHADLHRRQPPAGCVTLWRCHRCRATAASSLSKASANCFDAVDHQRVRDRFESRRGAARAAASVARAPATSVSISVGDRPRHDRETRPWSSAAWCRRYPGRSGLST